MTEDLKTALITWPRAPYQCGSAEGWMQKAHDRIVELEEALADLARQKTLSEMEEEDEGAEDRADFIGAYDAMIGIARAALQPKAGS